MSTNRRRLNVAMIVAALCTGLSLPAAGAVAPKKKERAPASIKACASAKTGALRIRKKRGCRKGERPLVWSVRGPRGPKGPRGLRGTQGGGGDSGANGPASAVIFTARATAYSSAVNPGYASVTGATQVTATESQAETLAPAAGFAASNLAVRVASAPGAGSSLTVTLRANGADTPLTCTIAAADTTCSNTSVSAAIPAGSTLSIQVSSTGAILTTTLLVGFQGR
ncbi:MAG: hypothetical protein ACRDKU_01115 [Gaiellaceae bacterium]